MDVQRLFKKTIRLKKNKLEEIRFKCKVGNSFDIKNTYLEQNIEELTAFFDCSGFTKRKYYLTSREDSSKQHLKERLLKMEMNRQK